MSLVGGIRARLIRDSLYNMINDALTDLGWFNPARQHAPIQFVSEPFDPGVAIGPNTLGLGPENMSDSEVEMGSNLTDNSYMYWLELMAESSTLGLHLITDLRDVVQGRFPTIGRETPSFPVWDYRQATPEILFTCQIENVAVDMTRETGQAWRATWYGLSFYVVDTYGDEFYE